MSATLSRRSLLAGITAAPAAALPALASAAPAAIQVEENPALVAAWKAFRAAETEYYAAKDALEWLADEWKHLWPLAPEEILGVAEADIFHGPKDNAERDIIGRPIKRDRADLTKRLSRKFREKGGQTCFAVDDPDELAERLAELKSREPRGRTERARQRYREWTNSLIAEDEMRLPLAREYRAETNRLREAAGVEAAKARIARAGEEFEAAAKQVGKEPARTVYGLSLKADTVVGTCDFWDLPRSKGFLGDARRLAEAIFDVIPESGGVVS